MRDITNYEGLYAITEDGKVWSYLKNRYLKPQPVNDYPTVDLHKDNEIKRYYVHRLVAEAFIPNPDNLLEVNHKDENRNNPHVNNLEWCLHQYNTQYSVHKREKSIYCIELDKLFSGACSAARELGIQQSSITACLKGRYQTAGKYHWRYVDGE